MNIWESIKNTNWRTINFGDVIEGCLTEWLVDYLNPVLKEKVERVSKYRMKICSDCYMNDNGWCNNTGQKTIAHAETGKQVAGCGCALNCKTALLRHECPAAKWKAVP